MLIRVFTYRTVFHRICHKIANNLTVTHRGVHWSYEDSSKHLVHHHQRNRFPWRSLKQENGEKIIVHFFGFVVVAVGVVFYSQAEVQDDLAIASIENVFACSHRYGHSDLKSD